MVRSNFMKKTSKNINIIIVLFILFISSCIFYFFYNKNTLDNTETFKNNKYFYDKTSNSYCLPGSFIKNSNIGPYIGQNKYTDKEKLISNAKKDCDYNSPECKGFTVRSFTNKQTGKKNYQYILKKRLTGTKSYNSYRKTYSYDCFEKKKKAMSEPVLDKAQRNLI